MGDGYPGPIVTADRVFAAETRDRKDEIVHAFDRATGKEIWKASWQGSMTVPFFAMRNGSWIRATPASDGDSVYVGGIRDVLVSLDAKAGTENWKVDFVKQYGSGLESFGFVCSPLLDGDFLYVQSGAGTFKFNKKIGKEVWRTLKENGGMMDGAFSSPVIATVAGKRQLLVQTRQNLCGVDLENGTVLWQQMVPNFRGMNILTPTQFGSDTIFTSSHSNKSFLYRIVPAGEKFSVETLWTNKQAGYMASPVIIDGHAYLPLQNRRLTCIDLKTGESKWTTRPYGEYWSMVAQGNRILALDNRGELYLIEANPKEFKLLDTRKVSEQETWGHLAVCGNEIFIREQRALSAYIWK